MTPRSLVYAEIYDMFAADYERTRVPRFRPFVKKLLELYDTRPKSKVLDAGTGTGLAATMVAPRVGHEGRVVGVDASEKQLEIARTKAKNFGFTQCVFVKGDLNELEFPDAEFDLVICSFALNGEPGHLFSEFRRVLKPEEGILLCQDWSPTRSAPEAAYEGLFLNRRVKLPEERLGGLRAAREELRANWDQLGTPTDYARILNECGFVQAHGRTEAIPQHFDNGRAYMEWRALEPVHKAELEAMGTAEREQFDQDALKILDSFDAENGLNFEWVAVQVVAKV